MHAMIKAWPELREMGAGGETSNGRASRRGERPRRVVVGKGLAEPVCSCGKNAGRRQRHRDILWGRGAAATAGNHDVHRAARQHVKRELRINLVLTYKVQPRRDTIESHGRDIAQTGW